MGLGGGEEDGDRVGRFCGSSFGRTGFCELERWRRIGGVEGKALAHKQSNKVCN